ncbi:hypothetical protein [Paraburkholderia lycopersici]|uniref:hypothetical protein n=1 Tax=Paraburkholderia lycopersici TaxID=416944 RepID=UPI001160E306|nr:hypothetical protein [Paraburkholderia lycopersici]
MRTSLPLLRDTSYMFSRADKYSLLALPFLYRNTPVSIGDMGALQKIREPEGSFAFLLRHNG